MCSHQIALVPEWYSLWLISRTAKLPTSVFNIFHSDHRDCTSESHQNLFARAFTNVAKLTIGNTAITIDEIICELIVEGVLGPQTRAENLNYARYFVFSILGFQTALYCPSPMDFHGPQPHHLSITEEYGCCNYTHAVLTQDINVCARESFSELLMGFGVLLPSKNLCLSEEPSIVRAFHQQVEVEPRAFNAYALHSLTGLKFKWTDALSCHLEFNHTTKEVSLFRFPSFCQFYLTKYEPGKERGVLHSCATTSRLRCQWATEEEINHFLLEVILSYRLLFGQTKKSRALFRSVDPFLRWHGDRRRRVKDPILSSLCGSRSYLALPLDLRQAWSLTEKETYNLPQDFPILRYRIVILQSHLSAAKPRTLTQLWRDKRNSADWMTFWAVIVFGSFGSVMAFLQVILQLAQLLM
ncbi:hypothetical protein BJX62DRAFT_246365 [Aspergillus germanicus]